MSATALDDDVTLKSLQMLDDLKDVVAALRTVDLTDIGRRNGVELLNVVVDTHQGVVHLLAMNKRGIAEHADFGLWAVVVAQTDGVVHNLRKVRVTGGLAITGKGDDVRQAAVGLHLPELGLESFSHLFASGERKLRSVVGIEATLTIHTVEGAHLAVGR